VEEGKLVVKCRRKKGEELVISLRLLDEFGNLENEINTSGEEVIGKLDYILKDISYPISYEKVKTNVPYFNIRDSISCYLHLWNECVKLRDGVENLVDTIRKYSDVDFVDGKIPCGKYE